MIERATAAVILLILFMVPNAASAEEPYHEVHEVRGVMSGTHGYAEPLPDGCSATCGTDSTVWVWEIPETAETVILELTYERKLPTYTFRMDWICPDGKGDCIYWTAGTDVLRIRVDRADVEAEGQNFTGGWAFDVRIWDGLGTQEENGVGAGVALDEAFDLYVSVFHHAPAPDDHTALPG